MFKYLWLDTETTGLDPVKNDIIQLSGVAVHGDKSEEFDFRVRPVNINNVTSEAGKIHGITKEQMIKFESPEIIHKDFKEILKKFVNPYDKTDKFILSGQNVQFDCDFVNQFFIKMKDKYWFSWVGYPQFDLKNLAILYEMSSKMKLFDSYRLKSICDVLGIQLSKAHNSLVDIKATREACKLIWQTINR